MEVNAFSAGIEPGGLTMGHEIKILICFLLCKIDQCLTMSQISDALLKKGLVNYFALADAMSELLETGHVVIAEERGDEECYTASELGMRTAAEFSDSLPLTVREKAMASIHALLARQKNAAETVVDIQKVPDGFMVHMVIPDIGSNLLDFSLFMPTMREAEAVKRQFLRDPLVIYKGILALMTGDLKTVGQLIPSQEELYED